MEQSFRGMSKETTDQRISSQRFYDRIRKYLISLTDEAEADRLIQQYHTELDKCRKDHWRPETAGAAVFLGLLHK